MNPVDALNIVYAKVPKLNCLGKCSYACHQTIGFIDAEYDRIVERIGRPIPPRDGTTIPAPCPLLSFLGTCTVHDIRPLICRIWGATKATQCRHGCQPADGRWLSEVEVAELFAEAAELTGDAQAGYLRMLVEQLHSDPDAREVLSALMSGDRSAELATRAAAVRRRIRRRAPRM